MFQIILVPEGGQRKEMTMKQGNIAKNNGHVALGSVDRTDAETLVRLAQKNRKSPSGLMITRAVRRWWQNEQHLTQPLVTA